MSIVPIRPANFDFDNCSPEYGQNLLYQSCFEAASLLPGGNTPQAYTIRGQGPLTIPRQVGIGGSQYCYVKDPLLNLGYYRRLYNHP